MLSHVWNDVNIEASRSPVTSIFLRFKNVWDTLSNQNVSDLMRLNFGDNGLIRSENWCSRINNIADEFMENHVSLRNDYLELLSLTLICTNPPEIKLDDNSFQRPDALHKARWMAKLLYSLKMVLCKNKLENELPKNTVVVSHQMS